MTIPKIKSSVGFDGPLIQVNNVAGLRDRSGNPLPIITEDNLHTAVESESFDGLTLLDQTNNTRTGRLELSDNDLHLVTQQGVDPEITRQVVLDEDLKTVNGISLLGDGDISIPAGETGPTGATGPQGPQGPAGSDASATTDASLLTSGTLADARLSGNVVLTSVMQSALNGKQDADLDLLAIAGLTGTGYLQRTGVNTWSLGAVDLSSYATTAAVAAGYVALGTSVANRIPKRTGTAGQITDSGIAIDSSNNVTGVGTISAGKATFSGSANTDFMEFLTTGAVSFLRLYQPSDASGLVFYGGKRVGFGNNFTTVLGQVHVESSTSATKTLVLRQATSQNVPVLETQSQGGTIECTIAPGGIVTGGLAATPVTFAVLNATTATATLGLRRITDRGSRLAYPDGTNWRFLADDAIIS